MNSTFKNKQSKKSALGTICLTDYWIQYSVFFWLSESVIHFFVVPIKISFEILRCVSSVCSHWGYVLVGLLDTQKHNTIPTEVRRSWDTDLPTPSSSVDSTCFWINMWHKHPHIYRPHMLLGSWFFTCSWIYRQTHIRDIIIMYLSSCCCAPYLWALLHVCFF